MTETAIGVGHNQPPSEFELLVNRTKELVENAEKWIKERPSIQDEQQAAACDGFLTQLKTCRDSIEAERMKVNKPLREEIEANNEAHGRLKRLVEICEGLLKPIAAAWLRKQQQKLEEERERKRQELERQRAEEERLKQEAIKAVAVPTGNTIGAIAALEEQEARTALAAKSLKKSEDANANIKHEGSARARVLRTVWHFEVQKPELVPDEWWKLDETKIGQAVRRAADPVRDIPGVRIWDTQEI